MLASLTAASVEQASTRPLWIDRLNLGPTRAALSGRLDVDVAIVGGGFSGLWTALYLKRLDPSVRVAVIEREYCGFGASGRNGGWCIGELAGPFDRYAARSSPAEAMRLMRAGFGAVDEVGERVAEYDIDCDWAKGGTIRAARTPSQARRQAAEVAHEHQRGLTEQEIRLLSASETKEHLAAADLHSGIFFGPTAALDPARLVQGLASACERLGVQIVEGTPVTDVRPGWVVSDGGRVRADFVVRATEAYTRDLPGMRRRMLPVYSLMVGTEPLAADVLDSIGLRDRQTFSDDRRMVIYGQRTGDGRLAFGGRAVPYLFGSKIKSDAETHLASHQAITETLCELLPQLGGVRITHRWGGVLAIPRNWLPGLNLDRSTGLGWLGGYVGEGVAASNLAGRTMAELVLGQSTPRTDLPWVGVHARDWEPEPLRWLGVRVSRHLLHLADQREERTGRDDRLASRAAGLLRGD